MWKAFTLTLAASLLISLPVNASTDLVDLHAHLFMPEATGVGFFGDFDGPLYASSWEDRLSTRVNADAIVKSGAKIVVVAFYAHPLFLGTERESVRRQILAARHFLDKHPEWTLALNSADARAKLAAGKHVMIFSIEGASGIVENDEDLNEFVDKLGVRIITPVHFTDDAIGGAAFMPGIKIFINPIAALHAIAYHFSHSDADGVWLNPHGLTDTGKALVEKMVARGVWIDLSHSSDATYEDIKEIVSKKKLPLLFTHTILRANFRAERGISKAQLEDVKASEGIIGLLPSDDMLEGTTPEAHLCPEECAGSCYGGIASFLTQYSVMSQIVPAKAVMIGSDIDAPLTFLRPSCPAQEKANPKGYWEYSQLAKVTTALSHAGLVSGVPDAWTETFLDAWSRVR